MARSKSARVISSKLAALSKALSSVMSLVSRSCFSVSDTGKMIWVSASGSTGEGSIRVLRFQDDGEIGSEAGH